MGVTVLPIGGDLAEELGYPPEGGLLVQTIRRGSSAANAGIRGGNRAVVIGRYEVAIGGDLLVSINGRRAEDANSIPRALRGKRAGDSVEVELIRSGKRMKIQVTLQAATEERL
jgi:S1-C subfamily serine protease